MRWAAVMVALAGCGGEGEGEGEGGVCYTSANQKVQESFTAGYSVGKWYQADEDCTYIRSDVERWLVTLDVGVRWDDLSHPASIVLREVGRETPHAPGPVGQCFWEGFELYRRAECENAKQKEKYPPLAPEPLPRPAPWQVRGEESPFKRLVAGEITTEEFEKLAYGLEPEAPTGGAAPPAPPNTEP